MVNKAVKKKKKKKSQTIITYNAGFNISISLVFQWSQASKHKIFSSAWACSYVIFSTLFSFIINTAVCIEEDYNSYWWYSLYVATVLNVHNLPHKYDI